MSTPIYIRYPSSSSSGSNASVGTNGAAIPVSSTLIGAEDGSGNLQPAMITAAGAIKVDGSASTQPISGSVSITQGGNTAAVSAASALKTDSSAVTQPISASALPLPTGASTSALQTTMSGQMPATLGQKAMAASFAVAIASDQSAVPASQSGTWTVQPGNTANATPWLSTISQGGNSAAVSASNALKVDGSAVTQPISGTVTATNTADTSPATQNITVVDSGSTTTTGQNSQSIITGTPTANSAASFTSTNIDTVRIQVTGTWTGTLQSEFSVDGGTTWYVVGAHISGTVFSTSSYTANVSGVLPAAGFTNYRIRATAAITGTATVKVVFSVNPGVVNVANPIKIVDATGTSSQVAVTASNAMKVDASATTQPVSGTVTANIGTSGSLALDASVTGLQVSQGSTTSGQKGGLAVGAVTTAAPSYTTAQTSPLSLTTAGALRVDGSAVTQPVSLATVVPSTGRSKANAPVRNDYTSTSVTTGAYVQLVASTTSTTNRIEIFDSSGQTLKIATGAAASEVDLMNIFPGGNGIVDVTIPSGTRVSVRAVSATASVGELDINFWT